MGDTWRLKNCGECGYADIHTWPAGLEMPNEVLCLRHRALRGRTESPAAACPDFQARATPKRPSTSRTGDSEAMDGNVLYSDAFNAFWSEYPRKTGKRKAYQIWVRGNLDKKIDTILKSVRAYCATPQWQDVRYIPHGATFLNQARWEDEIEHELSPAQQALAGIAEPGSYENLPEGVRKALEDDADFV